MEGISPYLFFQGNCEEAVTFYHQVFGGDLKIQRFGETEMPVDDAYKDKVMHAELIVNGLLMLFSDGAPHKEIVQGNNIQITLNFTDENEQATVYEQLADGGKASMPIQRTFWGAKFGMLVDKFGVHWMLNCDSN